MPSKGHRVGRNHNNGGVSGLAITPVLYSLPISFLVGYALLEKKLLPRAWWKPLSAFYFYPLMVPNLLWRTFVMRQPYFSDVDAGLMLGAVPMAIAGHVRALHADGVRAVINLQAEYAGPAAAYAVHNITQLRIPVVDHTEPTVEQLEEAVSFIALHRARGERVLVHCKGGHGRSAAVALAWLMSEGGGRLTPAEGQRRLSSIRHVRSSLHKQEAIQAFFRRQFDLAAGIH